MLTDAQAKAATPRATMYELDADGQGLKLRVLPSGVKSWSIRYRTAKGDRRRHTIGLYPDVKLATARKEAAAIRDRVRRGDDPNAQKEAAREALRMVDLLGSTEAEGWYLSVYVKTAGKLGTAKAAGTIEADRYRIGKHLRSRKALMRKPVGDVTVADIQRIKAETTAGTWRQLRDILRVCFSHAEEIGAIPAGSNPAAKVKATAARKVERYLTPDERKRLDAALEAAEGKGPGVEGGCSKSMARVFRLLSLTGMRLGEVADLQWESVDWRHGQLRVMSKTGPRSVPLTQQAIAFLRAERGNGKCTGLVCPDRVGGRIASNNIQRAWRSIREAAGIPDVRIHDLRHSWASDAVSAGVPLPVIGAVLGHRSTQTTARYAHLHDAAIKDGLAKAGAAIEAATKGEGR